MDTTPTADLPTVPLIERLRELDPADAPDLADELADALAAELDASDEAPADPDRRAN
jgi:hypothetical protein